MKGRESLEVTPAMLKKSCREIFTNSPCWRTAVSVVQSRNLRNQESFIDKKKMSITHRKELFYYVTLGSNVARDV